MYQILPNCYLAEIWELLLEAEICVASDYFQVANVSTEHLKQFKPKVPLKLPAMHSSDSEQSSDDSGAGVDPHQSSAVPNSLLQLQDNYASGLDSAARLPLNA